jgi:hypothetical protein
MTTISSLASAPTCRSVSSWWQLDVCYTADSTNADDKLIITTAIGDDGTFELATTHALSQKKAKGAPSGAYTITYLPPGETQDVMPVTLPDKVTISSGPNELAIELGDH